MGRWLKKIQKSVECHPLQTSKTLFAGLEGGLSTAFSDKKEREDHATASGLSSEDPSPAPNESARSTTPTYGIESIIRSLRDDAGRDLGEELTTAMRRTMSPLGGASRADLCVVIDDAFEAAVNLIEARHKALLLLSSASTAIPETSIEWTDWIAEQCLLLPDDRYFIEHRLATVKAQYREARARWYVQAWRRGEEGEPSIPKKTNAGRRAANMTLLPSV